MSEEYEENKRKCALWTCGTDFINLDLDFYVHIHAGSRLSSTKLKFNDIYFCSIMCIEEFIKTTKLVN